MKTKIQVIREISLYKIDLAEKPSELIKLEYYGLNDISLWGTTSKGHDIPGAKIYKNKKGEIVLFHNEQNKFVVVDNKLTEMFGRFGEAYDKYSEEATSFIKWYLKDKHKIFNDIQRVSLNNFEYLNAKPLG